MKIISKISKILNLTFFLSYIIFAQGKIKTPSFISDNMVLQQNFSAPIWGWAEKDSKIIIIPSWGKKNYQTTADQNGDWSIKIKTPSAGGPYSIIINNDTLKNILIGEVWICSGQSNMQWSLEQSENSKAEIPKADFPNIRMFYAARDNARQPNKDVYGSWKECTPEVAKTFSAVAYYFGKELFKELNVPIGLLHFSWGGSPAQAWTNPEVLAKTKEGKYYLDLFNEKIKNTPPGELPRNYRDPGANYYGMIKPLIPFAIKGAIWYQGENNVFEHEMYRNLFETMITNWRNDWGQGDFPFYFVQLAPFNYSKPVVGAALRDAQRESLEIKNTGMAVTLDIGNPDDIHPKNKLDVGKRLALWALAKTYNKNNIVFSGPIYKSMKVKENKIILQFDYIGSGLLCKGEKLTNFTIAGEDKVFHKADAVIEGNEILVSSNNVKTPAAVRYAFENTDQPNLFNKENLPASTFRTDNWEIITEDRE